MTGLPRSVQLSERPGGLSSLCVEAPGGSGEIYLHGAHLVSWTPRGHRPVLWMSETSMFAPDSPIRGGVPVCFPWFNLHPEHPDAPKHGFARVMPWELIDIREHDDSVSVRLRLRDTVETRASLWPHRFEANLTITIGAALELALEVINRDTEPFAFEEAFHSYFAVGDVTATSVGGMAHSEFSVDDAVLKRQAAPVRPTAAGISRRYRSSPAGVIEDPTHRREIRISASGATGVVLWNPGQNEARSIADFADDGWLSMLCFETCNVRESAIRLAPGERHRMTARIMVVAD